MFLRATPARSAPNAADSTNSPIPINKKIKNITKIKNEGISLYLKDVMYSRNVTNIKARLKREANINKFVNILKWVWPTVRPIIIVAKIIVKTSITSSKTPILSIVCPSFVFTRLNSSSIGKRTASPTVANEDATNIDISHGTLKT